MTIQKAKESGFTHIGTTYRFIKIYAKNVNADEPEITRVNWFWNYLLGVFTDVDVTFEINDGFYMEVVSIDDIITI